MIIVKMRKKALLIRLDKIGDLICTLPVDQVLDESEYDITWIIQKGMGPVVDLGAKKRKYIELDKNSPRESAQKLRKILNELEPMFAVSFQCPWWVNYEIYKANIAIRAGVKSQWHSFLFLNHGIRQKRSRAEKHEYEYNLELIQHTMNPRINKMLQYFEIAKPESQEVLKKYLLTEKEYIVVHPGMMGSALNWPQSEYIKYIHRMLENSKRVVITGTDSDEPYLNDIKKEFRENPKVTWLQSELNLKQLVQVLAFAEYVVAPSTGVAHLTASVGGHIKAIFSPITVHHPKRWGPRGPHVEILMLNEKTLNIESFF